MKSPAVVSTLQHVTDRKLVNLSEKRNKFEEHRQAVLAAVRDEPLQEVKVQKLIDGLKSYGIDNKRLDATPISSIEKFLAQSKHDSSVSSSLLSTWQASLKNEFEILGRKYEHASLFGRLVTEWIQNPNPSHSTSELAERNSDDGLDRDFELVGREEMHKQRKDWEFYALNERKTDQATIIKYLGNLFEPSKLSKKFTKSPFEKLREKIEKFDDDAELQFESLHVKMCIEGILQADLFAGKKRQALHDLKNQPEVLEEMAHVLNQDLASLNQWQWATDPVQLFQRRHVNGKYRVYMDEEFHQAILLHFIGTKWACQLRTIFTAYLHNAWLKPKHRTMSKEAKELRQDMLKETYKDWNRSVRAFRQDMFIEKYFLTQLPQSLGSSGVDYDEMENHDGDYSNGAPAAGIKQDILRLITTEMLLNKQLYGQFTVVQSDFKWFGPSLPHSTILAVLRYFGVQEKWLELFGKFLQPNVVFTQDGANLQPQARKCGIPMSHALSVTLGEAVLFCLDTAVNKAAPGANLYRLHDDLWIWGEERECIAGWKAIEAFTKVMGLELNMEKTGTASIFLNKKDTRNAPHDGKTSGADGGARKQSLELPAGEIRWGFLKLDRQSQSWTIDRQQVDEHIHELQRQLDACRSIFAWVRVWNTYVTTFISNNFGKPATCLGRDHVQMSIETLGHIQRKLFGDDNDSTNNVGEYLRKLVSERFGVSDLPDGFFYFPAEAGGLEVRNPFIPILLRHENSYEKPAERIEKALESEEQKFEKRKEDWSNRPRHKRHDYNEFMDYDTYIRYAEETSTDLRLAYEELMKDPAETRIEWTKVLEKYLFDDSERAVPFTERASVERHRLGRPVTPYWRWVIALYGETIMRDFGGLELADRRLLPMGLLSMLRSEKVRWQG